VYIRGRPVRFVDETWIPRAAVQNVTVRRVLWSNGVAFDTADGAFALVAFFPRAVPAVLAELGRLGWPVSR
jgi:hypothetical protein